MFGKPLHKVGKLGIVHRNSGKRPSLIMDMADGRNILDGRIVFTRADTSPIATYFDKTGVMQYGPTNAITQSAAIDNVSWTQFNTTVTANTILAPDGTLTADKIVENGSNAQRFVYQPRSGSNETVTISAYMKAGERTSGSLTLSNFVNAAVASFFDLVAGTVIFTVAANGEYTAPSSGVVNIGNGWFRCWLTVTKAAQQASNIPCIGPAIGSVNTYQGDSVSGIYAWGVQVEVGPVMTKYIPTSGSAASGPRFDYDPVLLTPKGLLIEEGRTNSIRNSTMVGAVVGAPGTLPNNWAVKTANGLTTNVIATGIINGIAYTDIEIVGTPSGAFYDLSVDGIAGFTTVTNTSYCFSYWSALAGGSLTNINVGAGGVQGAVVGSGGLNFVASLTSIMTRGSVVVNVAGTNLNPTLRIATTAGQAIDITVRLGAPQFELGAFATSFIPTVSGSIARASDVVVMPTGSWFNTSAGSLEVEAISAGPGSSGTFPGIGFSGAAARVGFVISGATGIPIALDRNSAATQLQTSVNPVGTAPFKIAQALSSSASGLVAVNGTTPLVITAPSPNDALSTVTSFGFTIDYPFTGWIKRVRYWPRAISNAELILNTT